MKPAKTGYIQIDTAQIYFEIYGGGKKPLLLLHGNGESTACFKNQFEAWGKDYTLIAMDSRGQGKSTFGRKKLTVAQIAADGFTLLEALDIKRASVVGFSDGANAALAMLLSDKNRVIERAVLAGANLNPKGVKEIYQKPIEFGFKILARRAQHESAARKKLAVMSLMVREPNFKPEELGSISVPVLVAAGSRDMVKEAHTKLIAASIPNSRLEIIQGCDHFLFEKAPDKINKIVLDFLNDEEL